MAASWAVPIVPTGRGREERGRERFSLQQRCRGVLRGARVRRGRAHAGLERLRTKSSQLVTLCASKRKLQSLYTPAVATDQSFTAAEARRIGEEIGIDWSSAAFDVEQFRAGMDVELEHGLRDPATNVIDDDAVTTGKIALAHLNEFPDYYTRLEQMEENSKREHGTA